MLMWNHKEQEEESLLESRTVTTIVLVRLDINLL